MDTVDKLIVMILFIMLLGAFFVTQYQIKQLPQTTDIQALEQRLSRLEQRYTNIHIKALKHKWKEQEVSK